MQNHNNKFDNLSNYSVHCLPNITNHLYAHSTQCMCRCVTKKYFSLNALLHIPQTHAHSPLCKHWWIFKPLCCLNKHFSYNGAHQYVCVMCYQIAMITVCITANISNTRALTNMDRFMSFKTDPMTKCIITHITNVTAITTMYALMSYKPALVNKWIITHFTGVRALTSMYSLMFYQTALLSECLITHITNKSSLTSMPALMYY